MLFFAGNVQGQEKNNINIWDKVIYSPTCDGATIFFGEDSVYRWVDTLIIFPYKIELKKSKTERYPENIFPYYDAETKKSGFGIRLPALFFFREGHYEEVRIANTKNYLPISNSVNVYSQRKPSISSFEYSSEFLKIYTDSKAKTWYMNDIMLANFQNLDSIPITANGIYKVKLDCEIVRTINVVNYLNSVENSIKRDLKCRFNWATSSIEIQKLSDVMDYKIEIFNTQGFSILCLQTTVNSTVTIPFTQKGIFLVKIGNQQFESTIFKLFTF